MIDTFLYRVFLTDVYSKVRPDIKLKDFNSLVNAPDEDAAKEKVTRRFGKNYTFNIEKVVNTESENPRKDNDYEQ